MNFEKIFILPNQEGSRVFLRGYFSQSDLSTVFLTVQLAAAVAVHTVHQEGQKRPVLNSTNNCARKILLLFYFKKCIENLFLMPF